MSPSRPIPRSVLIVGGSYSGLHAAQVLIQGLPTNWSITLVERNTHFNHVYSFPRYGVVGNAQRAFVPYTGIFGDSKAPDHPQNARHRFINANVTKITKGSVYIDQFINLPSTSSSATNDITSDGCPDTSPRNNLSTARPYPHVEASPFESDFMEAFQPQSAVNQIEWDFLIYALGSKMPDPLHLPAPYTKSNGVQFLNTQREQIARADRIVIVGGGALGIQYASDITHRFRLAGQSKSVTLIHSRIRFLPQFNVDVHLKVKAALEELGVQLVLGERVDLIDLQTQLVQRRPGQTVAVQSLNDPSKTWPADLVFLCTGQVPNTQLMAQFCPLAVAGGIKSVNGLIKVKRTMQVSPSDLGPAPVESTFGQPITCECASPSDSDSGVPDNSNDELWQRVFAVGDCIDGFGAIKAGHTGWNQAEVAAKNVIKMVEFLEKSQQATRQRDWKDLPKVQLEEYFPGPPMIKLTVGLDRTVCQQRKAEGSHEVRVIEKVNPGAVGEKSGNAGATGDDDAWKHSWISRGIPSHEIGDGWD